MHWKIKEWCWKIKCILADDTRIEQPCSFSANCNTLELRNYQHFYDTATIHFKSPSSCSGCIHDRYRHPVEDEGNTFSKVCLARCLRSYFSFKFIAFIVVFILALAKLKDQFIWERKVQRRSAKLWNRQVLFFSEITEDCQASFAIDDWIVGVDKLESAPSLIILSFRYF